MAEIVRSPFDGDKYYDIDIVRRIDSELFEASAALHLWYEYLQIWIPICKMYFYNPFFWKWKVK